MSGKELKFLKLETEEEKSERRRMEKLVRDQKKKSGLLRHGLLRDERDCLLSKTVQDEVAVLVERYNIPGRREEIMHEARSLRYKYLVELAKALQHYLPLDKDFLRWLKFICPKLFLESDESEGYLAKIALCIPGVGEKDVDDLRQEVRILKGKKKEVFEDNLEKYLVNVKYGYKKVKGSNPVESIDQVWAPVFKSEEFPVLTQVLKSALSIFHATASVEGAVNTTRNILGDRSHRLTDSNLEARKILKSLVKEAPSDCCYDFKVSHNHHDNWKKAFEECMKSKEPKNQTDTVEDQVDEFDMSDQVKSGEIHNRKVQDIQKMAEKKVRVLEKNPGVGEKKKIVKRRKVNVDKDSRKSEEISTDKKKET